MVISREIHGAARNGEQNRGESIVRRYYSLATTVGQQLTRVDQDTAALQRRLVFQNRRAALLIERLARGLVGRTARDPQVGLQIKRGRIEIGRVVPNGQIDLVRARIASNNHSVIVD